MLSEGVNPVRGSAFVVPEMELRRVIPAEKQPRAPESTPGAFPPEAAIRELRQSGLTVGDIARLFGVHPKVVASILDSAGSAQRRDLRKEVSG